MYAPTSTCLLSLPLSKKKISDQPPVDKSAGNTPGGASVGKLEDWSATQSAWVSDALHRAAIASGDLTDDAEAIATRVQAAFSIVVAGDPQCNGFDDSCFAPAKPADAALLCSIGPLEHVDRLASSQQLKLALNGVTLIFGENGSGKSGYARAARRLCTSRVSVALQGNVYSEILEEKPTVTFGVKFGVADPVTVRWTEGSPLPDALSQMSFLDTANARPYVESKTEILFLPPEIRCLTTLGQLYKLAGDICQRKADVLSKEYGGKFGVNFATNTTAGTLVARLSTNTSFGSLPSIDDLQAAGAWDSAAESRLAELRILIAQGPAAQARALRRMSDAAQLVIANATGAIELLGEAQIGRDKELLDALVNARAAADAFAADRVGRYPIIATGNETWRRLFLLARQFAAEAGVAPPGASFEIGDPCVLCQRPLDETARDRLNQFDAFIAVEAAAGIEAAKKEIAERIAALRDFKIETRESVRQLLAEPRERDGKVKFICDAAAETIQMLNDFRTLAIKHLEENGALGSLPDTTSIEELSREAEGMRNRAEELEVSGGVDPDTIRLEAELKDAEALAGCLPVVLARRSGLVDRLRYLDCVAALNTRSVSDLATKLRSELITPDLRKRLDREIAELDLGHIPLKFVAVSDAGKSFFEMALDGSSRAKKSQVLSEGEQRALAIACFLADCHVSDSSGAIIVDDPVTSLDHQRTRRVAKRLVAEAASGRQVVIFTHNLLFYQEVLRACADRTPQVPALPCLIQQSAAGFGLVSNDDQPWIAKKVKERITALELQLKAVSPNLATDSEGRRIQAKQFYTDLRETWERAVEEVVLGGVVERFGTDVKTQSLKVVDFSDPDYRVIFFAMKRASEHSGHDQAAGKQVDPPDKSQMEADLVELKSFIAAYRKKAEAAGARRRELEQAPRAATL